MTVTWAEQPTPETEPAEPPPGGVDAIEYVEHEVGPWFPTSAGWATPTAKDVIPDEVTEPSATDGGASSDGASEPEKESPA